MRRLFILKMLIILCSFGVLSKNHVLAAEEETEELFSLVTDASTLKAGDILIITSGKENLFNVMESYDKGDNCKVAPARLTDNKLSFIYSNTGARLILGGETDNWTLFDGTYYLYAAGTSSNPNSLKGRKELLNDNKERLKISIDENSKALIQFKTDAISNIIKFYASSPLFSCYSSANASKQKDIYLFRKIGNLNVGKDKLSTFYSDKAFIMPEGVTGGVITKADKDERKLSVDYRYKSGMLVPANTALLVKGETNTYSFDYSSSTEPTLTGNYLHGADAVDEETGNTLVEGENVKYYILSHDKNNENLGFYWAAEDGAPIVYKKPYAFLAIDFGDSQTVPTMLSFGHEDTSDLVIHELKGNRASEQIFSITGSYVGNDKSRLSKGMYISAGKKILVK